MDELQPPYIKWLDKNKLVVEIVLSVIVVMTFLVASNEEVLMLSMLGLGGFYFIDAIFLGRFEWSLSAISTKLFSLGASLFVSGLVPPIMALFIGKVYIIVGTIIMGASGITLLATRHAKVYHLLLRLVTIGILAMLTFNRYDGSFLRSF